MKLKLIISNTDLFHYPLVKLSIKITNSHNQYTPQSQYCNISWCPKKLTVPYLETDMVISQLPSVT
jgi:hypothetical protein